MAQPRVDSRLLMDAQVEENDFLYAVLDLLHKLKYIAHHDYDSRKTRPDNGFPDICALHPITGMRLWIELKTLHGKQSGPQRRWMLAIERSGDAYHLWTPIDWSSGLIEAILKRGAGIHD